jgi:hypothetical protein
LKISSKDFVEKNIGLLPSSVMSNQCYPQNVFDWTDSFWLSEDSQNSTLSVIFISFTILISGYRLKTYNQRIRPTGWMLEGSSDNLRWNVIDKRNDELNVHNGEASFSCKSQEYFSFLRFTQTGMRSDGCWHFLLKSVEFFGCIKPSSSDFVNLFLESSINFI